MILALFHWCMNLLFWILLLYTITCLCLIQFAHGFGVVAIHAKFSCLLLVHFILEPLLWDSFPTSVPCCISVHPLCCTILLCASYCICTLVDVATSFQCALDLNLLVEFAFCIICWLCSRVWYLHLYHADSCAIYLVPFYVAPQFHFIHVQPVVYVHCVHLGSHLCRPNLTSAVFDCCRYSLGTSSL